MRKKNVKYCKISNFHEGYAPFFLPIFYEKKKLKISKKKFAKALSMEGIPLGVDYGCIVSTWKWAKKYFSKKFTTPNSIKMRDNCFHLYLNENYKYDEAKDIVDAVIKVENYYLDISG